jgi:hypothetical protein
MAFDTFGMQQVGQRGRHRPDARERLITQSDDHDTCGSRRRVLDDIREAAIERYERPALRRGDGQQTFIGRAGELLVTGERNVVARISENRPDGIRDVLVELHRGHSYAAGIGTIVSRASSAA